uniref:Transmembrane protein n=1 Tax=Populus trichocarpa TaxID=3694 RepID=A0A3N7EYS1_POPTR
MCMCCWKGLGAVSAWVAASWVIFCGFFWIFLRDALLIGLGWVEPSLCPFFFFVGKGCTTFRVFFWVSLAWLFKGLVAACRLW